jgi:ribonuclease HII
MTTKKIQRVNFTKNSYELTAWANQDVVCGIDEVGRGCLAGPLVTAAVILPPHKNSRLLKDSKLMTLEEREKAFEWISKNAYYGIGMVNHRIIDSQNIWQATLIGMKRALINLLAVSPFRPKAVLIDAMPLKLEDTNYKDIPVHHFYKGESKSSSIAAASIIAKVTRDRLMTKMDPIVPGYLLGRHKGYSTSLHQDAVKSLNYSIIHRQSFLKSILAKKELFDAQVQQSLFTINPGALNLDEAEIDPVNLNSSLHLEFSE